MGRARSTEIKRAAVFPLNFHPSCSGTSVLGSWHPKIPSRFGRRPAQHGQRLVRTSHKTIPQALDSSGCPDVSREGLISSKTANGLSRCDVAAINLSKVSANHASMADISLRQNL